MIMMARAETSQVTRNDTRSSSSLGDPPRVPIEWEASEASSVGCLSVYIKAAKGKELNRSPFSLEWTSNHFETLQPGE